MRDAQRSDSVPALADVIMPVRIGPRIEGTLLERLRSCVKYSCDEVEGKSRMLRPNLLESVEDGRSGNRDSLSRKENLLILDKTSPCVVAHFVKFLCSETEQSMKKANAYSWF